MDPLHASRPRGFLKATTLLESVLALGLLAGTMSLAVLMHARTIASAKSYVRLQAWSATEEAFAVLSAGQVAPDPWPAPPGMELHIEEVPTGAARVVHATCLRGSEVLLERRVILPTP